MPVSDKRKDVPGVIDRIIDGRIAVILLEEEKRQFDVPVAQLPADATPGSWLRLGLHADEIVSIELDVEMTQQMKERIHNKAARLRSKRKVSKFRKE